MAGTGRRSEGEGWRVVRNCPACGAAEDACRCAAAGGADAGRATMRLRLERRNGKAVTVLAASGLAPEALAALLKELKSACAAGGTVKGQEAELQGEHRERARAFLKGKGLAVKG